MGRAALDSSRPEHAQQHFVGLYLRGGFGAGVQRANVRSEVTLRSSTLHGAGEFDTRYQGVNATFDGMVGVRLGHNLVGLSLVASDMDGSAHSTGMSTLGLNPRASGSFTLLGPSYGYQIGRGTVWTLGGTLAWAHWRTDAPNVPYGVQVQYSQLRDAGVGLALWGGPSWALGRGWMIGGHLRLATFGDVGALIRDRDATFLEAALVFDVSFESP